MRRSVPLLVTLATETIAVVLLYGLVREPSLAPAIAFGCAVWLLGSTVLYLAARLSQIAAAAQLAARITLPVVRRRVDRALAASLLTGALVAGAASPALAGIAPSPEPSIGETPTTVPVADPDPQLPIPELPVAEVPAPELPTPQLPVGGNPPSTPVRTGRAGDAAAVVPISTSPSDTPAPAHRGTRPSPGPHSSTPAPEPAVAPALPLPSSTQAATGSSYTVVAGDNFWEIAARHLAASTGRDRAALTNGDIVQYWVKVCDANRDRIRSGDVSLIYAGEVVELPPV